MDKIVKVDSTDLICPKSLLRQRSVVSREFDENAASVVRRLASALSQVHYGTGLSAIQIGVPVRIAVISLGRCYGDELVMIDPTLVSMSGRLTRRYEGCLSLPGFKGLLARRNKITVEATDIHGKRYVYSTRGYEAAIIQHEIDHMDGLFYWDRMDGVREVKELSR